MTDHVSVSAFLAPLSAAVKAVAVSRWVAAEVSEVSGKPGGALFLVFIGKAPSGDNDGGEA